jgi:hypothetical protein
VAAGGEQAARSPAFHNMSYRASRVASRERPSVAGTGGLCDSFEDGTHAAAASSSASWSIAGGAIAARRFWRWRRFFARSISRARFGRQTSQRLAAFEVMWKSRSQGSSSVPMHGTSGAGLQVRRSRPLLQGHFKSRALGARFLNAFDDRDQRRTAEVPISNLRVGKTAWRLGLSRFRRVLSAFHGPGGLAACYRLPCP